MKKLFTLFILAILSFGLFQSAKATTCAQAVAIPGQPTFPYVSSLTCGTTNDITSANSTACGSSSYKGGWEAVYVWTPTANYIDVSFAYSGQTWTGIFLYQGCPTSGGVCIGNYTSSSSSKTLAYVGTNMTSGTKISLNSGTTYYLVIDTYPSPNSPCPGTVTINGTLFVPCSGTPAPGNTISTANPACSGVNFTLSLQNTTPGVGLTYQWQSSPNGSTWSNVGTSLPTYTTSQTAATYYRCQVTCSGNTGISNPVYVTMAPFYYCYCVSSATSTADEEIFNVTVGALNNSSTCTTLAPGAGSVMNMYSNYVGYTTVPDLKKTGSQPFSVEIGTCGGNYGNSTAIYIDYNQNGSYLDAGEQVYLSSASTTGPHTETGSFTVPGTALIGLTGMRVINVETSPGSITPCGTYSWGETEDYVVSIYDVPSVTTGSATAIAGTSATLNATVSANYSSTTVKFEYGTQAAPPFSNTVTLASPVTGQSAAVNAGISSLQPNTTYNYRVVGTNSAGTTNGTVLSFTTAMVPPSVVTDPATTVGSSFATLNGTGVAFNAATTVSFEWGTTNGGPYPNPVAGTPTTINGITATSFYAAITGLAINTNYYYRAKAVSGGGTVYGTQQTFYTTCVVPPTPGAIVGPAQVCKTGTGYTFSVPQVPYGFYYNWIFPTGFTITSYAHSNVVTVDVAANAISGTVSVIAVSDCGANSPPSNKPVTVNNLPTPTLSGASPVCQGPGNEYTTQAGMSSYVWSVTPDGTITPTAFTNIVSVSWSTTGAKTVGVIYTNPSTGCTAAAPGTIPVTVTAAPVPNIQGSNHMCANSGYYNYTTESGKTNYVWTVSSGGTITAGQGTAVVEVTWNTPGAQTVSVNYANSSGCYAITPSVMNVTVDGLPGAAGTISGTSNVCFNSTSVAYSVAPISNTAYYVWTLPAGAVIASGAGTPSITVDFTNATAGNITVYGNSLCGNGTTSPPFPVTITELPDAAGSISGIAAVCEGTSGISYSVAPIAGATGYRWVVPTGATIVSGDNTPEIIVDYAMGASSGAITVYGFNFCGNGTTSPDFAVTVGKKPEGPVISQSGDVLTSSVADGNQWYYNGAQITGATEQSLTALYDGWYWDVIITDGCASDTSNNIYVVITGVEEPAGSKILVFPVPNEGRFTLQMNTQSEENFTVTVYNNIGAPIYEKKDVITKGQSNLVIDLRPVPNGIYTIILRSAENRFIRKITVNK